MPMQRFYSHFCYFNLDLDKMRQAAGLLTGEHDFKSFCSVRTQVTDTVRTIYSLDITKVNDLITIRISGSGFLYNMVRAMVGTCVYAADGKFSPDDVPAILEGRNRTAAGPTVPAGGLYMTKLWYQEDVL